FGRRGARQLSLPPLAASLIPLPIISAWQPWPPCLPSVQPPPTLLCPPPLEPKSRFLVSAARTCCLHFSLWHSPASAPRRCASSRPTTDNSVPPIPRFCPSASTPFPRSRSSRQGRP